MDRIRPTTAQSFLHPRLALAVAATLGWGLVGCENAESQADRRVQEALQEARVAEYQEGGATNVQTLLNQAAAEAQASAAVKARANALLGQSALAAVVDRLPELAKAELQVSREISDLGRAGGALSLNTATIDSFRASNPSGNQTDKPLEAIQQNQKRFSDLAAQAQQRLGKLNQQTQQAEAKVADAQKRLSEARTQAADLAEKSDHLQRENKSEESLNIFKQAADARLQAGRLATELAHAEMALNALQTEQAGLQRETKTLQESAAAAEAQLQLLNNTWAETQKLIETRTAALKTSLGDPGVAGQVKTLDEAQQSADEIRATVIQDLDAAIAAYEKAASAAGDAARSLTEREAQSAMAAAHSPSWYRLEQARSLQMKGNIQRRHAALVESQQRVVESLTAIAKTANLSLPADLGAGNLQEQIKAASASAQESFQAVQELLGSIAEGGGSEIEQNNALAMRAAARYGLYALTDQQQHLTEARNDVQQLVQKGAPVPQFPAELTSGIQSATPASGAGTDSETPTPDTATPNTATPENSSTPPGQQ